MDQVGPLPHSDQWREPSGKSQDIPPIRLHRFGSEDLHASRKLEVGMDSSNMLAESTGTFPRTSSLTLGQCDDTQSFWRGLEKGEQGTHSYRVYLQTKDRITVSPWNEIPLWTHDSYLRAVVKTPRGRWAELDVAMEDQGAPLQLMMRKGQLSHYSVDTPWHVCLLPQTWADPELPNLNYGGLPYNGKPFEVVELSLKPRRVGEVYVVKILGGFAVIDMELGQLSWKLIAIDIEDMSAAILHDISDLHQTYPGLLEEIREWLRICNCIGPDDSEAKFGLNERAADRQAMMIEITQAHTKWQTLAVSKKHLRSGKGHRRTSSSIRPITSSNPESNEIPPPGAKPLTPEGQEKDVPATKLSVAVPKFIRRRARNSRPAYFDSLASAPAACPPPTTQSVPNPGPPPTRQGPPTPRQRNHPVPPHSNPANNSNGRVLTIRTSEGIKALDSSRVGKIIIRQNKSRADCYHLGGSGPVGGSDIVRRRSGVETISPRGRGGVVRVKGVGSGGFVTGSTPGGAHSWSNNGGIGSGGHGRDQETGLVYATAVQINQEEVGEIPVATALEKENGREGGTDTVAASTCVTVIGKGLVLPEPILIPSRSSSGSTIKTPSMSPPSGSPSTKFGAKSGSGKDRRVSWGWVEEVEIPSREGDGSRKDRGKREAPKREGKVLVSKSGS